MLGSDASSLYMVFMGTKHVRDVVADANLLQEAVWQDGEQQVISTSLFPTNVLVPLCITASSYIILSADEAHAMAMSMVSRHHHLTADNRMLCRPGSCAAILHVYQNVCQNTASPFPNLQNLAETICHIVQSDALAHRGFLARSRRIPVEALFGHAQRHGKRLVLCGEHYSMHAVCMHDTSYKSKLYVSC